MRAAKRIVGLFGSGECRQVLIVKVCFGLQLVGSDDTELLGGSQVWSYYKSCLVTISPILKSARPRGSVSTRRHARGQGGAVSTGRHLAGPRFRVAGAGAAQGGAGLGLARFARGEAAVKARRAWRVGSAGCEAKAGVREHGAGFAWQARVRRRAVRGLAWLGGGQGTAGVAGREPGCECRESSRAGRAGRSWW